MNIAESEVQRFLRLWEEGDGIPEIASVDAARLTRDGLLELALIDQKFRARCGASVSVERYLGWFAELQHPEAVISLLYEEICQQHAHGGEPNWEGYRDRFPGVVEELQSQWKFHRALSPGPHIEGYTIESRLGGQMADVYRATVDDPAAEIRDVAIKILPLDQPATDEDGTVPSRRQRFHRECRMLKRLNHPHVVRFLSAGAVSGGVYLVTEFINGTNIRDYCAAIDDGFRTVTRLMMQTASAIAAGHQKGILHRDLKPDHLIVTGDDRSPNVKLIDFGLGRFLEDSESISTGSSVAIGTLAYIAPEQFETARATIAVDVYGLGAVLYTLLCGQVPHHHPGVSRGELMRRVVSIPPKPVRAINPAVSPPLADVCTKALSIDPALRFASADEFAQALQPFA